MKLGGMASGADFFDRTVECAALWRYLEKDHVVASGPRRLGKSSIVNRLREEASAKGILAAHVDVQGIEGAQAFVDELTRHFPDASIKGYLSAIGGSVKGCLWSIKLALNCPAA
jgi:AAA+ ATPase superfamily predicted ATPase